jgi:hypothetical protein
MTSRVTELMRTDFNPCVYKYGRRYPVFRWLSDGKPYSSGAKSKSASGFFINNIAKMPAHHIDLSQVARMLKIKKGRINSDLPFLKTKELINFEVAHRLD